MTIARIILAGAATFIMSSAALAEQGMITKIDRLTHTISIQPTAPIQTGTVGASTTSGGPTGPAEDFKAQDGLSLDDVHVGDRINYTTTQNGAAKTITKLERQK
jgi:Copper binding periplasmic protein CusF